MDMISIIAVVAFVGVFVALMILRDKSGNRFEVRNPDIVLALILTVIILFATGKIQSFEFASKVLARQ